MKFFLFLFQFYFFVYFSIAGKNPDVKYYHYIQTDILTDKGFTSKIEVEGESFQENLPIMVPYSEGVDLSKLLVYYIGPNGKLLKANVKFIYSDVFTEMFYTGVKFAYTVLPKKSEFKIVYVVKSEIPQIYSLPSNRFLQIYDTANIKVNIPPGYLYLLDSVNLGYKATQKISIVRGENKKGKTIEIKIVQNRLLNYDFLRQIDKDINPFDLVLNPELLLSVFPEKYKDNPWVYISDWVQLFINDEKDFTETEKKFTDSIVSGCDKMLAAKRIFEYVRSKINYLAIENGISAFKPQPANFTFANKYGDCKAKALLLTKMLNYKGYQARFCIASSRNSDNTLDFPAAYMGDHAVCVLKTDDQDYLFLDPTITTQQFGSIPLSVYGKKILAIPVEGYQCQLLEVPDLPADSFALNENMMIDLAGDSIYGKYHMDSKGYLPKYYQMGMSGTPNKLYYDVWNNYLSGLTNHNCNFSNIGYSLSDNDLELKADFSVYKSKIIYVNNERYLVLNFLPYRISSYDYIPEGFKLKEIFPMQRSTKVVIKVKEKPHDFKEVKKQFKSAQFQYNFIVSLENNAIVIQYDIKIDKIVPSLDFKNNFNNIFKEIEQTFNYAIKL